MFPHGRFAAVGIALALLFPGIAHGDAWIHYGKKPLTWYETNEAKRIARNVLDWQTERGDWPNDTDSSRPFEPGKARRGGSFDDRHTTGDIRFLERMFRVTGDQEYAAAITKAVDLILASQYANGGFPQNAHPGKNYTRYITFNDQAMVDILRLLRDIAQEPEWAFLGKSRQRAAATAFEKGVECILACQVTIEGRLTIWGAQHDERTLRPAPARKFEPASLATSESAGILRLLMSVEEPSLQVREAIRAGAAWFRDHSIKGIRVARGANDVIVLDDPTAPPTWARFYDLESQTPIFAGRDGVVQRELKAIERERRLGYGWYGDWGTRVARDFERWSRQFPDEAP